LQAKRTDYTLGQFLSEARLGMPKRAMLQRSSFQDDAMHRATPPDCCQASSQFAAFRDRRISDTALKLLENRMPHMGRVSRRFGPERCSASTALQVHRC
jgi:hypothetical protein